MLDGHMRTAINLQLYTKKVSPVIGISMREFARRDGCDPALVRQGVKKGKLVKLSDGSVDPDLVGSNWRLTNVSKNSGGDSGEKTQALDGESLPDAALRMLGGGAPLSYADALRMKENYLALLRQLEFEQKSGELIELSTAETVLFESFRSQRDLWLNWPSRIGPLLAAQLGFDDSDKLTNFLAGHVHKHITDIGELAANFVKDE